MNENETSGRFSAVLLCTGPRRNVEDPKRKAYDRKLYKDEYWRLESLGPWDGCFLLRVLHSEEMI